MSQRRDILKYLGLGLVGAGIAITVRQKFQPAQADAKILSPTSATSSKKLAIESSGKTLPELQGISNWINSEPLTLASLRGDVVLLQFWTFACSNCQATIPHLVGWHDKYADKGIENIESNRVLELSPINDFGTPAEIVKMFGGPGHFRKALKASVGIKANYERLSKYSCDRFIEISIGLSFKRGVFARLLRIAQVIYRELRRGTQVLHLFKLSFH